MNSELKHILQGIKERTGIDVCAYSESLKYYVCTKDGECTPTFATSPFTDVLVDESVQKTFFKFKFRGANFVGVIDGGTKIEKNYAYFILSYLESSLHKENVIGKKEYIKNIVLGDSPRVQTQRFMRKFAIEELPCFVFVLCVAKKKLADALTFLENYNLGNDYVFIADESTLVYLKYVTENADFASPTDFVSIILETLQNEVGVDAKACVGCTVDSLCDANVSYAQAQIAFRMSNAFSDRNGVFTYKQFVWVRMLEEMPKYKIMEYLEILSDKNAAEIFMDEDMLLTADEFFENSLNISETARKLFMHRNTLMYRLDKIERMTGLNIKRFADAQTFKLITVLHKLTK